MSGSPPGNAQVLLTLMRVSWRRLVRSRAPWICALIAALPILIGAANPGEAEAIEKIMVVSLFVLVLLPPVLVAASIGEEIEDRTTTYLWSRPIGRWTIIVGKLLALAPVATVLVLAGWILGIQATTGAPPDPRTWLGLGAGTLAVAAMSAGLATLVPRHGMALSIVYLVILDLAVGALPASIRNISITRHVRVLAGFEDTDIGLVEPAIGMVAISALWLAIAFWRIRRLES